MTDLILIFLGFDDEGSGNGGGGGGGGGGDEAEERRKRRKSRWGSSEEKVNIPGMPTILPSAMTSEQQELYIGEMFFSFFYYDYFFLISQPFLFFSFSFPLQFL